MKNCIICKKENEEEVCESCIEFFKWKYGKGYIEKIKNFQEMQKRSGKIKFRRKK